MRRREFLGRVSMGVAAVGLGAARESFAADEPPSWRRLPRWRGVNLLELFRGDTPSPFRERDFEWLAKWGLDFVRLPADYRSWTDRSDPNKLDEKVLGYVDQAVAWGKQHGVHVQLNLHRAPGYCVNPPAEPLDLWTSPRAQDQFAMQWRRFAERYKGVPAERLSFDLLNEPKDMDEAVYARVLRRAIAAIREADPARLIVADGLRWGRDPVRALVEDEVAQSTRGYDPMRISHFRASWVGGSDAWGEPTWPLAEGGRIWDRDRLSEDRIRPWKELQALGPAVHVGEWGAYNRTPHAVALSWMSDQLALWREAGWGWALWNLRGAFGFVDSGRKDVSYEKLDGHDLDRKMLETLLADGGE